MLLRSSNCSSFPNFPSFVSQIVARPLPVGEWVHVEAFYHVSSEDKGEITIFQDGHKILQAQNVQTGIVRDHAIWGIGNATDHVEGGKNAGSATVFFDDAIISRERVSSVLNPDPKR